MRYVINKASQPDWNSIEKAPIVLCVWSPNAAPAAYMQGVYTEDGRLIFKVTSLALPTRAENVGADSAVWEDSCLEFFLSFDKKNYVNLEANANSALRASFGPDRHDRAFLKDMELTMPKVQAQVSEDSWCVTFEIAPEMIKTLWGVELGSGTVFTGNFYSCGDKTPAPHYASWNPIDTPSPDFHRPEFFGELVIE